MSKRRTHDVERLCAMFKALASPQRLQIFLKLADACCPTACDATAEGYRCCVGDLGQDLDVKAPTVSHHLKELRQAGLMRVERRGKRIECLIGEDALRLLAEFFADTLDKQSNKADAPRRSAGAGRR